ncbi:MAG: T9SS type A sorting domain-containing protein [Bacteroidota bacterium]
MKKNLMLLLICILPLFGYSQWTSNVAVNTLVKDNSGVSEVTPLSATANDGSTYVSWFESTAATNYKLMMQRISVTGQMLWGTTGITVSSFPQNSAIYRYDLNTDNEGNAVVVFQDERSGHLDIVAYKLDTAGNMLWGSSGIALTDSTSAQGLGPTIGITSTNDVIIAWNADAGNNKWIAFQKISAAGNVIWPSVKRIISGTVKYSRPTMVPATGEDFIMLYVQESGSGFPPSSQMFSQRFDSNGDPVWTQTVTVSMKMIPFFFFPKAVTDHNAGFYVSFSTSLNSNPTIGDVYVQHVDFTGALWSIDGIIASAYTTFHKFNPVLVTNADGTSSYVVMKFTDLNQSQSGIYIQKFNTAGFVQLGNNGVQVVPVQAAYNDPFGMAISPTGIITGYTIGNAPSQTMAAVKTDTTGNSVWVGNSVTLCSTISGKDDASCGVFMNNQLVFVWEDERIDGGVYAQNISDAGQVGPLTVSISENKTDAKYSLIENPSQTLQLFSKTITENAIVKLTDVSGKKCGEYIWSNSNTFTLKTDLKSGLYIVQVKTSNDVFTSRWMKINN